MNKKLAIGAGVAAAAIAVAVFVFTRHSGPHHEHREIATDHGIDDEDTNLSLTAMLNAAEGSTSCETAFSAIEAERQATKLRGSKSLFEWVAPKPEFLAACATLPDDAQKCMMPRYRRDHPDDCVKARPAPEVLKKMVVPAPAKPPG